MTEIMANELLNEWVERLGLTDWCIVLRINVTPDFFENPNTRVGETEWENVERIAIVKILDEKLYKNRVIKYDFEEILVHELLHIKFNILQENPNDYEELVFDQFQHQLIEDLAQALVMAKRGETKRVNNLRIEKVKSYSE